MPGFPIIIGIPFALVYRTVDDDDASKKSLLSKEDTTRNRLRKFAQRIARLAASVPPCKSIFMKHATGCGNRVFAYARISTKEGRQHGENQLREIRKTMQTRQLEIVGECVDEISGIAKKQGAGLKKALLLAEQGLIDFIAVHQLSRLTRQGPAATFALMHRFLRYEVRIISVTEPMFDGQAHLSEMLIGIAAYIAAEESRILSERIKAGQRRAQSNGITLGRSRRIFDSKKFAELREKGASLDQLAKDCNLSRTTTFRRLQEYEDRKNAPPQTEKTEVYFYGKNGKRIKPPKKRRTL